jgi:hypothetical protein
MPDEPKKESSFLDEQYIKEIEDILDNYESKLGLPAQQKMNAPAYLTMSLAELRKKSPDELAEAVFEINQYSLFIQREINKNRAWLAWSKSKLNELAAGYLPEVGGHYGFNERELIAKNSPPMCKRLNAFTRKINMELERMYGVPDQIRAMADSINDMKYAAIRREKNFGNPTE